MIEDFKKILLTFTYSYENKYLILEGTVFNHHLYCWCCLLLFELYNERFWRNVSVVEQ